jgi:hypothetical protein
MDRAGSRAEEPGSQFFIDMHNTSDDSFYAFGTTGRTAQQCQDILEFCHR